MDTSTTRTIYLIVTRPISRLVVFLIDCKFGHTSYFSTVVLCAYLLAVVWLAAFVMTVVIISVFKGDYTPESLLNRGLPVSIHTQRLQCFLTVFEFCIILGVGVTGHLLAREEGSDPPTWRPKKEQDEKVRQHHGKSSR